MRTMEVALVHLRNDDFGKVNVVDEGVAVIVETLWEERVAAA